MNWKKMDLHHHTYNDSEKTRRKELKYYKTILKFFSENNGSLIAITDHNSISWESIRNYRKEIEERSYNISVLPGIELSFTQNKINTNTNHKFVDIILIFNPKDEEMLKEIFNDNEFKKLYNDKPEIDNFGTIVTKLWTKKINFLAIPHFAKSSDCINYEDDCLHYYQRIISFDLLEGRYSKKNHIAQVDRALKYIATNGKDNQSIVLGTDAHDIEEFKNNIIKKVPFYYTDNTFEGIEKLSRFGEGRIQFPQDANDAPPYLANYVKQVEISLNNVLEVIDFDRGLNSIIGRRGTGKSLLLKNIYSALEKNGELDLPNDVIKHIKIITSSSNPISIQNVQILEQSDLANKISSYLKYIHQNETSDAIKATDLGINLEEIDKIRNKLKEDIQEAIGCFKDCLSTYIENKKNKLEIQKQLNATSIYSKFKEIITIILDQKRDAKEYLDKDKSQIDEFLKKDNISPWLKSKIIGLKKDLKIKSEEHKYLPSDNLNSIKSILEKIQKELSTKSEKYHNTQKNNQNMKTVLTNCLNIWKNLEVVRIKLHDIIISYRKFIKDYQEITNSKILESEYLSSKILCKISSNMSEEKFYKDTLALLYKKQGIKTFMSLKNLFNLMDLEYSRKKPLSYSKDDVERKISFWIKDKRIDNLSYGEQQENFIANIIDDSKDIILLDQPDDDLDSITIKDLIIKKINEFNVRKQLIVVTHDPKIVINADSKKIILANYKGDENFGNSIYRNIDKKELENNIFKIIDGKKSYLKARFSEYGGYKNEN